MKELYFSKHTKMQCPRDQDALIPKPRGSLPKVCAAVLAATAIGCVAFQSPERLLGWVAITIFTHTLSSLLYGFCLVPEEMLHHANTRYHSGAWRRRVIAACGLGGRTLLALVLSGIFVYRTDPPLQDLLLLLLAPLLSPLLKSLRVLGPSEVEVSDICEKGKMNVAHGLAWSFYLGYLRLVLPRLVDSIHEFKAKHQADSSSWGRGSMKLLILVPLNANISHKLEDEDSNISFYDNLPNSEIDRAGVRGRVYKHSVYRVQDQQGKTRVCAVEYATPLLTLYKMSQESSAGFGERERRQQVLLFFRTLQEILESSLECRNRYTLILLNDDHDEDPHFLSKVILNHLHQQEEEEFFLDPPVEKVWNQMMSCEPSLMISLERPQPLREAVENTHQTIT